MHWDASGSTTVSAASSTSNWWAEEIQCEGEAWEYCNKQGCIHSRVSFALLLQIKICTTSKPVSRKMTHPGHLKEFLQLGKRCNFSSVLLIFSCSSASSNLSFFLHTFLPAAMVKNFSSQLFHSSWQEQVLLQVALSGCLGSAQRPVHTEPHEFHRESFHGLLSWNCNTWTMDISTLQQHHGLHVLSKIYDRCQSGGF